MYKIIRLTFSVLMILSIANGCSDRGVTSVSEKYPSGEVWDASHVFGKELGKSMFKSISFVIFKVYIPDSSVSGYGQQGHGKPLPVLYMLSPFKEDVSFYFSHGLQEVADRMIAAKEIKPMMIVCINGTNDFGGSFYGNSEAGGKFAELIGKKTGNYKLDSLEYLIDYVDAIFNTDTARGARGISGVEMGGYGAMRIAMEYSENYSSVSSISAPLDFDGGASGDSGFIPLFKQVINGLDTSYRDMGPSDTHPLQSIFIGASCSFSPHDTGAVDVGGVGDGKITDLTTYFHPYSTIEYHLPFDSTGEPYQPIWNLWLDNNPPNMLAKNPTSLNSTAILLMAHTEALYGYYQQTVDFHSYLTEQGIDHTYLEFEGYPGFPATAHRFIYDILPKILKFHSDNFVVPE